MNAKQKKMLIGVAAIVIVVAMVVVAGCGIFRGFNAEQYVSVVLAQNLKGEVKSAVKMTKGLTEEEAKQQYEATISSFVKSMTPTGLELTKEQEKKSVETAKKIFDAMKYEVQEAEKISDDEYKVPVKYQPTDVFAKLQSLAEKESVRLTEKMQKGEYRGTTEEINKKMQDEFASNFPTMLEEAYKTMEYKEEQTMDLVVKKGESGLYILDGTQTSEFIKKIIGF